MAVNILGAPHLSEVLRISSIILLISALNGAQTGALAGFEAFKSIAYVNLFVGILSFPALILGAYFANLLGVVYGIAINLCIQWFVSHLVLRKEAKRKSVPFTIYNCFHELSVLWRFSLPAALTGALVGPVNWVCNIILVNQPSGYDEMGVYSAANQWYNILIFLPCMIGSVALPIFSDQLAQKDKNNSIKTLILTLKSNFIIVTPLILIASISSPIIMRLYGDGFIDGWPTLLVVLITAGLMAVTAPVGQLIAASGKMWIGLLMNIGWAVIFISCTLFMFDVNSFGIASSRLTAYSIHSIWVFVFVFYLLKITDNF
jgi:O-antigen/teichoic acid export membrane protein